MLSWVVNVRSHPRRSPDSAPGAGSLPFWSYRQTGTLPRLISFVCHSYENCRGVYPFFPFWNSTSALPPQTTGHYSSLLFSNECRLFCRLLRLRKTQLFCFQAIPRSLRKTPGGGVPIPENVFFGTEIRPGWGMPSSLTRAAGIRTRVTSHRSRSFNAGSAACR